jgi:hypothetical protein
MIQFKSMRKDFAFQQMLKKNGELKQQRAIEKKDFFSTARGSNAFHPFQDRYIENHFLDWVTANIFDDERDVVLAVSNLLAEEPDLVRDRSWGEIVRLAGR